jgi:hypothetical protein
MKNRPTSATIGAAHNGPGSGFAFRRGPLLNSVDAGGAAATTATSTTTTSEQGAPGTAPASTSTSAPAEKMVPQSQVNTLIANARREGRDGALREGKQGQPAAQAAPLSAEARLEELELRRTFDRKAAKLGLDDEASDDLFDLYKAQRPTDVGAWFETKAGRFAKGTVSQSTTTTPNNQQLPTAEPAKPVAAAPSASQPNAVTPVTTGGLVDIYNLTPEQFATYTPQQLREHHETNVAAAQSRAGAPPVPKAGGKR